MNENEKKDLVTETEDTLTEPISEEIEETVEETVDTAEEIVEEASEEDAEDAALEAAILENGGKEKKAKKVKAPKAKKKFNTRKLRFGSMATVLTVVVLAALVLVSVVADVLNDRYPISLDLTADKTYTFSENSEKVAALVDREVNIVVFTDESFFKDPSYTESENTILKQFYEFTKKYESLTGGKVKTTYINPSNDPTAYAKYEKYGVDSSTTILMHTEDRSRTVAMDELFEIESNIDYSTYQYVDTITGSNVENVLAANLQFLCREEVTNVTILTGHNEQTGAVSGVTEILEANGYEVSQLNLTTAAEFDEDTKMLVIAAPASDFNADEIQRLRTWLNNEDAFGRHMLVMVHQTADCPNLYEFLKEEYYVEVTDNQVAATDSADKFLNFSGYNTDLYTYADLEATDYVGDLDGRVIFPFARQLVPLKDNNTDYAERVVPLISFPDTVKLSPIVRDEEAADEEAELVDPDSVVYGALMAVYESYNNDLQQSVSSYVMVCGAQEFLTSGVRDYVSTAVNEAYFLNVVSSLLGHEESIQISTRDMTTETLEFDYVAVIVLGLVVFTVGIPLVMLILCLVVFIRRKNL